MRPEVAAERERRRRIELKRCQESSWYLATEYLNYGWNPKAGKGVFRGKGLTERLHKPVMGWYDANRSENFIWTEIARFHHKTTMAVCLIIQDILIDPNILLFYFHAVEGKAREVLTEVAWHLQHNKKLRTLDPVGTYPADYYDAELAGKPYKIFPSPSDKNFGRGNSLTVGRSRFSRFGTLMVAGALSESTGAHANKAYLDDIIGRMTVRNGQVGAVQDWLQNTVFPVVDDLVIRAFGTPWCDWGPYVDWRADQEWLSLVIPGSTVSDTAVLDADWSQRKIEFPIDDKLEHPIHGPPEYKSVMKKRLRVLEQQMKSNFRPQILCDPSPRGEKPWDSANCEHYIDTLKEVMSKPGVFIALSDPAPMATGAYRKDGEKERGGEKDYWAHAVLYIRANGFRQEIVVIEGAFSQEWDDAQGWAMLCQLQRRFNAYLTGIEGTSAILEKYQQSHEKAASRLGVAPTYVHFTTTYLGKNQRFSDLASKARRGEVLWCKETCSQAFIDFALGQARGWRPMGNKNGLKHDDGADLISYGTDPEVLNQAPDFDFDPMEEYEYHEAFDDYRSPVLHIDM